MKENFIILALLFLSTGIFAQTTEAEKELKKQDNDTTQGWIKGGNINLGFGQLQLVNWAAGGLNSLSLNSSLNLFADYRKDKLSWQNTLDLAYGIIRQGDNGALWRKTDDRIDFASKIGYKLKKNLYFGGLYNFRSQFSNGYSDELNSNIISKFAAPAYSILALGLDYNPNEIWSVFLAPITLKNTIVSNQFLSNAGAFGVTPGSNLRSEFGGYFRFRFKKDIVENVNLETKLSLFSNYAHNPENIDVNWQVLIAMKVNKYLSATLSTQLLYDDDINIAVDRSGNGIIDGVGKRTQFKEVFGVGLSHKF